MDSSLSQEEKIHDGPLQLVDVDCNLWHRDLKPLLMISNRSDNDDDYEHNPFLILQHDDLSSVTAVLAPSSTVKEAEQGLRLLEHVQDHGVASQRNNYRIQIRTTVGIHPYHVNDDDCLDLEAAVSRMHHLLSNRQYKASYLACVGECGLDGSEGFPSIQDQLPYFDAQIQLALTYRLPIFVHERLAFSECIRLLDQVPQKLNGVPVIIHCFTGTRAECCGYVSRGYWLSVSGHVFKDKVVQEILQDGVIPLNRLMIETDAPYMGFPGCRANYVKKHTELVLQLNSKNRKRLINSMYPNVPSSLPLILDKVLEHINVGRLLRKELSLSRQDLARITTDNACRFFGFDLFSDR